MTILTEPIRSTSRLPHLIEMVATWGAGPALEGLYDSAIRFCQREDLQNVQGDFADGRRAAKIGPSCHCSAATAAKSLGGD
jgi:hypothetical protein